jgi:hypothetical protein
MLESKISEMSQSVTAMSKELTLLRKEHSLPETENEPSPSLLSGSLMQAIENAILSLVPTLVNRHLSQNPFITTS